ncbi:MAG: hypothetical protein Dasosvirus1_17 [Dasosvirus sp.]|uniref:Uncharacterized protein n=1 Tax=Dasosvirus sp. TaxID=2487764 RepID=A0A3G4ZR46_9VIRU|nr:MAG: hypothetical protein Dasosvirus1_17 [Dasosvirus sp.]
MSEQTDVKSKSNLELWIRIWDKDPNNEMEILKFKLDMNKSETKRIFNAQYAFFAEPHGEKGCRVTVLVVNDNLRKENDKIVQTAVDTLTKKYKSLNHALQQTKESLVKMNDEFNQNLVRVLLVDSDISMSDTQQTKPERSEISDEHSFTEKFVKDNEKLLTLMAGDKRISMESEKELRKMERLEHIKVERCTCEEYSWTMGCGDVVNMVPELNMSFSFFNKVENVSRKKGKYFHNAYVPIVFKNDHFVISNQLCDVIIENPKDKLKIFRMKVQKSDQVFICDGFQTDTTVCHIEDKPNRILPIKKYNLTDFKLNEHVFVGELASLFVHPFRLGIISEINERSGKIFIQFPNGLTAPIDLDLLIKYSDVPEEYRDKIE